MRYIALRCHQCSAPLDVEVGREQVSCDFCGSILHVLHMLPAPGTDEHSPQKHPRQDEIDQLDAEWEAYRAQYLPTDNAGEYVIPDPEVCKMGAAASGVIGVIGVLIAWGVGWWSMAVPVIILSGGVALVLLKEAKIAPVYQRSHETYQSLRFRIMQGDEGNRESVPSWN